jgi:putative oxidoreductase
MERIRNYLAPIGRILLCSLFVWAGFGKLMNPAETAQEFVSAGVPLPALMVGVAIVVELVGGLALLAGYKSSWAAGALAIWSLATGFAVHLMAAMHSTDPAVAFDNMIHFYKNLGVAGGLIYVVAFGAGGLSIDNWTRAR